MGCNDCASLRSAIRGRYGRGLLGCGGRRKRGGSALTRSRCQARLLLAIVCGCLPRGLFVRQTVVGNLALEPRAGSALHSRLRTRGSRSRGDAGKCVCVSWTYLKIESALAHQQWAAIRAGSWGQPAGVLQKLSPRGIRESGGPGSALLIASTSCSEILRARSDFQNPRCADCTDCPPPAEPRTRTAPFSAATRRYRCPGHGRVDGCKQAFVLSRVLTGSLPFRREPCKLVFAWPRLSVAEHGDKRRSCSAVSTAARGRRDHVYTV